MAVEIIETDKLIQAIEGLSTKAAPEAAPAPKRGGGGGGGHGHHDDDDCNLCEAVKDVLKSVAEMEEGVADLLDAAADNDESVKDVTKLVQAATAFELAGLLKIQAACQCKPFITDGGRHGGGCC